MYYLPTGTNCLVRKRGEQHLQPYTTKKPLAWEQYVERYGEGFIFWYGDFEIAVTDGVVERVFHRSEPKHIGELLKLSKYLQ